MCWAVSDSGAIGPMARTIEDVTLLFRILSGQDPTDPASPPVALREPGLDELRSNRIGIFEDDDLVPVTPETRSAVQAAGRLCASWVSRGAVPADDSGVVAAGMVQVFVHCGAMFYAPEIRGRSRN